MFTIALFREKNGSSGISLSYVGVLTKLGHGFYKPEVMSHQSWYSKSDETPFCKICMITYLDVTTLFKAVALL